MENISSHFTFDGEQNRDAEIRVIGVGGGGGNAVNNMIDKGIQGIEFVAINTDAQALEANQAPVKIQVGKNMTKGLGAGARPSIGAEAVEENRTEIEQAIEGCDMVFITAGMGGGTGTGGAPVVAAMAKRMDVLTVAIVTKPFECEGRRRMQTALEGIDLLREHVDTLIVIPNERLLDIAEANTSLIEAFQRADEVLYNATRGISDLITVHGLINLDFADVETTMRDGGTALMGASSAAGEERARKAAVQAISSPLLDGLSINGARNVLVNITAGSSLGIREATEATGVIQKEAGEDVEVIFGTVIDEDMGEDMRVTVIATGFDDDHASGTSAEDEDDQKVSRTSSLEQGRSVQNYKGEDNLKHLDIPAYERRTPPSRNEESEEETDPQPEDSTSDESDEKKKGNIKRLHADDVKDRKERIRKDDTDTPAFLRKMMD